MNKSVGIVIPEGCKQIVIFDNEDNFIEEINSGRMFPLYGERDEEKTFFPIFIAYKNLE